MENILSLPLVVSRCDTCNNENREDETDGRLLRCSVCKDRFYCSAACQARDWKEHKYNCSLLPPNGIELLKIESDQGREKFIRGYTARLIAWAKEHDEIKNSTLAASGQLKFASSSSITSMALNVAFPDDLQYERHPMNRAKHPYRSTLMLAARAGLIQLISRLSTAERIALSERIKQAKIPAKWARLFGPKIVARPGSLAPGEYEVFATLAPAFLLYGARDELCPIAMLSMEDKDFWVILSEAFKELWDAPRNDGK